MKPRLEWLPETDEGAGPDDEAKARLAARLREASPAAPPVLRERVRAMSQETAGTAHRPRSAPSLLVTAGAVAAALVVAIVISSGGDEDPTTSRDDPSPPRADAPKDPFGPGNTGTPPKRPSTRGVEKLVIVPPARQAPPASTPQGPAAPRGGCPTGPAAASSTANAAAAARGFGPTASDDESESESEQPEQPQPGGSPPALPPVTVPPVQEEPKPPAPSAGGGEEDGPQRNEGIRRPPGRPPAGC
jgi:hypothetical protein